ncbi:MULTISPECIES: (d)CMP kinase [Alicyclobacillus]|uniref:Cytidylate kinase n=1 Tax=Alicyclobacillus vulcanalis TaxID=252246 RepID=A0A1N7NBZ6_9BACL|nr:MULTISPECIES: (d)CMP kinase [Alicyclobacillus]SIS95913.1 cytidylate kinase [Alicyclobacillus vulcanalis]
MAPVTIAIDGPAGAGKSTVAKRVAERLNLMYVDTGAMYRAVAYLCAKEGTNVHSEKDVEALLEQHCVSFEQGEDRTLQVVIDGVDVTSRLREPEVSALVSTVAAHPRIRQLLTEWQRAFAERHSVVMDGRDIGTVVLPHATVKVFLTAAPEERARRRQEEYRRMGYHVSLEDMVKSVIERDRKDSERSIAPLRMADDAVRIDSTDKSIETVVDEIVQLVENAHVR